MAVAIAETVVLVGFVGFPRKHQQSDTTYLSWICASACSERMFILQIHYGCLWKWRRWLNRLSDTHLRCATHLHFGLWWKYFGLRTRLTNCFSTTRCKDDNRRFKQKWRKDMRHWKNPFLTITTATATAWGAAQQLPEDRLSCKRAYVVKAKGPEQLPTAENACGAGKIWFFYFRRNMPLWVSREP